MWGVRILRACRKAVVVGLGDGAEARRSAGHVEASAHGEAIEQLGARQALEDQIEKVVDQLFGLAEHDDVDEGRQWQRVRERQRAAHDHQGIGGPALGRKHGQAGQVEHLADADDLQLVAHREGQHGQLGDGPLPLVGEQGRAARAPGGDVVGQEGALGRAARVGVDLAVDGLEAERAHPHVVGARVAERDLQVGLAHDGAPLVGEPGLNAF